MKKRFLIVTIIIWTITISSIITITINLYKTGPETNTIKSINSDKNIKNKEFIISQMEKNITHNEITEIKNKKEVLEDMKIKNKTENFIKINNNS